MPPVHWITKTLTVGAERRTWFLALPIRGRGPRPALIFLHGLDQPAISAQAAGQYRFLSDHARALGFVAAFPRGSLGALPRFPALLGWGPAGEDANAAFVHRLADTLVRNYQADSSKIVLAGFSNGAFFAANELLRESPFRALFLSAGGSLPATPALTSRPRVYVEAGLEDAFELSTVRTLVGDLERNGWSKGKDLRVAFHPGGHNLYAMDFDAIWSFLIAN